MTWRWLEATAWKHLPYSGALLEQPEALMEDLLTISSASARVREALRDEK